MTDQLIDPDITFVMSEKAQALAYGSVVDINERLQQIREDAGLCIDCGRRAADIRPTGDGMAPWCVVCGTVQCTECGTIDYRANMEMWNSDWECFPYIAFNFDSEFICDSCYIANNDQWEVES